MAFTEKTPFRQGVTFDDVLLVPKHSTLKSRMEIDTGIDLGKGVKLRIPIVSANMKSVTEERMAIAIASLGGLALLHRFLPVDDQIRMWQESGKAGFVGASVGVKEEDKARLDALVKAGCAIVCVDVAHGDSDACVLMVKHIAKAYPGLLLIAGNVATAGGALRLWKAGADVVKVGVGPGSLCTTRIETGNGVPQLTALIDVHAARKRAPPGSRIIADGGIKNAGDIVKALCFSDCVMLGNLISGTDETPGNVINVHGAPHKEYVGSSTHKANHIEGVTAIVPYKGSVDKVVTKLMEGVRSGCSYQGVHATRDLQKNPEFVLISHAGLTESHPHNVVL